MVRINNKEELISMAQTGNILLCHNPFKALDFGTYESALIRKVIDSEWNHCVILYWEGEELRVAEAKGGKRFCTYSFDEWNTEERKFALVQVTCPKEDILALEGRKYDYASTTWEFLMYRIFRKWTGRKAKASDKLYCFEAALLLHNHPYWYRGMARDIELLGCTD